MIEIITIISVIILFYFALLWSGYLILLLSTMITVVDKFKAIAMNRVIKALNDNPLLPITVIIPAYNESKRIINTINALLTADYKNVHFIIVNDGSKDDTLALLIKTYDLVRVIDSFKITIKTGKVMDYYQSNRISNFIVVDKEHSPFENSAADCVNAGLNICRTPLFVTIDADTMLEKEALTHILYTYLITPHCVAVGGSIYVPQVTRTKTKHHFSKNIPKNLVLGIQVCEYLRSFLYGREGFNFLGGALCHPGAFTLFEKKAVMDVGGYDAANFSYDAEIIMKLHDNMRKNKFPYTVAYAPGAMAWSEEPHTLMGLWAQRARWQRGLLRGLGKHWHMLFNPQFGITGLLGFPYYVLFEVCGPVVEAISYIMLVLVFLFLPLPLSMLLWLLLLAWSYMLMLTIACIILSILTYNQYYSLLDIIHILGLSMIDMVFYRQWRAFCALFSSIHYFINRLRGKPE